ncbi:MAG: undecaprenyl-phosphate galactose phosphotransferase WbaP [Desulfovibrionaceae bacterium]
MALLFSADVLILFTASLLAYLLRTLHSPISFHAYKEIFSLLLLGPLFYWISGAYQSIALPPHREIKQLSLATSLTFLVILAVLFTTKSADAYSRLVLMGAWGISIFALPLMRGYVRRRFARTSWWGRPLVICGQGPLVEDIWKSLANTPERGVCPVEILVIHDNDPLQSQKLAACAKRYYQPLILLSPPENNKAIAVSLIADAGRAFNGVLLSPLYTPSDARLWVSPRDLGTVVGLLVRQNLLDNRRLCVKRLSDIVLSLLGSLITVPLGGIIALCIRCDSSGPVLYTQKRIGQHGKTITVYKFRTMVANADAVLHEYLAHNPDLADEWKTDRKLRQDPRLTKVGRFLRKTSLDELPQLWNVLTGSMSLVGPRPIVEAEIKNYGPIFEEYCMVKPGITGMWQISGRNNTSYEERVRLDHYYVSNWSVWMDLWILARTVPVVIMGYGAY